MDSDTSQPPSKPSVAQSVRSLVSSATKVSSNDVIERLYELDCQEGFTALIHIYKTESFPQTLREQAIDAVYEQCRGRYNGVVNNIRSMLLEYVMKVFVRFSISSMPVLFYRYFKYRSWCSVLPRLLFSIVVVRSFLCYINCHWLSYYRCVISQN